MTAAPQAPVVCILDSGTNEAGAEGWNYLAGNEDLTDEAGHGDLIYQLLESETPNARLIMLKCFESAEETEEKKGTEIITQALYDAVDLWQADVISISWTRNEESEELYEAVCYARENGAVLVAAAGNLSLSTPLGSLVYPAAWEEVIGVGGADTDEKGEPVSSLWYLKSEAVFVSADGNYEGEKGSSFAVPRVSGKIAEYLFQKPEASEAEIREWLKDTVIDTGEEGYDPVFGWGFLKTDNE